MDGLNLRIGNILDPIFHIVGVQYFGNQFQITHGLADGDRQLMSINYASERTVDMLSQVGNREQVLVFTESYSIQRRCTVQQRVIIKCALHPLLLLGHRYRAVSSQR
jgi:hypothetical protein